MCTRVLIVDDHPTFRKFARRLLEDAGFDVVGEAEDGAQALLAAERFRPAAVLLDVLLPDRSGFEVAAVLARGEGAPDVVLKPVEVDPAQLQSNVICLVSVTASAMPSASSRPEPELLAPPKGAI
jgi:CheY-like chemotaxis protein